MKIIMKSKTDGKPSVEVRIPETIPEMFEELKKDVDICWGHPEVFEAIDQTQNKIEETHESFRRKFIDDIIQEQKEQELTERGIETSRGLAIALSIFNDCLKKSLLGGKHD